MSVVAGRKKRVPEKEEGGPDAEREVEVVRVRWIDGVIMHRG